MTIFQDEKEVEQIRLSKLKTKADMHALFVEKGFRKKVDEGTSSTEEAPEQDQKALRRAERERDMGLARETMELRGRKQNPPNRGWMSQMVVVGSVLSLVGVVFKRNLFRRRNKSSMR